MNFNLSLVFNSLLFSDLLILEFNSKFLLNSLLFFTLLVDFDHSKAFFFLLLLESNSFLFLLLHLESDNFLLFLKLDDSFFFDLLLLLPFDSLCFNSQVIESSFLPLFLFILLVSDSNFFLLLSSGLSLNELFLLQSFSSFHFLFQLSNFLGFGIGTRLDDINFGGLLFSEVHQIDLDSVLGGFDCFGSFIDSCLGFFPLSLGALPFHLTSFPFNSGSLFLFKGHGGAASDCVVFSLESLVFCLSPNLLLLVLCY